MFEKLIKKLNVWGNTLGFVATESHPSNDYRAYINIFGTDGRAYQYIFIPYLVEDWDNMAEQILERIFEDFKRTPKIDDYKRTPKIVDVIFNDPATIVFWSDGTKTVVKCQPGDTFDKEKGLAMAMLKKQHGNNGSFNDILKEWCK